MTKVQPTQKITPFLWFDNNAEEAVKLYTSLFKNARVLDFMRYGDTGPGPKGSVMALTFQLEGQDFIALNGGPQFTFSPAISFLVSCETQKEIDTFWEKLSEGGEKLPCGWLKDQFGVTWQIVPSILHKMLMDKDPVKSERVMKAMLRMGKIEIKGLEKAYEG